MKITQIIKKVYLVEFPKHSDLCYTFLRFQEHFESPHFKNKIFTFSEYKKWYKIHNKQKTFTYCADWLGFNIPDYILTPFFNNTFKYLSKREKLFLNAFKNIPKPFYIIGLSRKSRTHNSQMHELAHALWHLNKNYKKKIKTVMSKIPQEQIEKIHRYLKTTGGYHPDVFEDESHAYILADCNRVINEWEIDINPEIHKELLTIHKQYNKTCKLINI